MWDDRLVRHCCWLWGRCLDATFRSSCSSFHVVIRCLQWTISIFFLGPFSMRWSCPQALKYHTIASGCRTASLDKLCSNRKSSSLYCLIFFSFQGWVHHKESWKQEEVGVGNMMTILAINSVLLAFWGYNKDSENLHVSWHFDVLLPWCLFLVCSDKLNSWQYLYEFSS